MKKINLFFISLVLSIGTIVSAIAQEKNKDEIDAEKTIEELNNYKYVVIPIEYSFASKENEYLLNSLTKHLLNKKNFDTYMDSEELPEDLLFDRCLALYVDVLSDSKKTFSFATKVSLVLKDCQGNIVFKTKGGESRAKDYKEGYHEALRMAFESFDPVFYKYNGGAGYYDSNRYKRREKSKPKIRKSIDDNPSTITLDNAVAHIFRANNTFYEIEKIEIGYVLKEKETKKRIAVLTKTKNNSILYNSDAINGNASFDKSGNLTIEYYDAEAEKMKTMVYSKIENE